MGRYSCAPRAFFRHRKIHPSPGELTAGACTPLGKREKNVSSLFVCLLAFSGGKRGGALSLSRCEFINAHNEQRGACCYVPPFRATSRAGPHQNSEVAVRFRVTAMFPIPYATHQRCDEKLGSQRLLPSLTKPQPPPAEPMVER